MLENPASGVSCLRRASFAEVATEAESGFAQAGHPLVVLTDLSVRSARPSDCGLPGRNFLTIAFEIQSGRRKGRVVIWTASHPLAIFQ
jgi:hypothetical protein